MMHRAAWLIFALGVLAWLVGLWLASHEAVATSLAALLGLAGLPVGTLVLAMSLALVKGSARDQLWPVCSRLALSMPALAVVLAPVLLGAGVLYEWTQLSAPDFRGAWLWWPGFALRGLAYLLLWWALAVWVLPGSIVHPQRAGLGLIAMVLTISLAAADWGMSVDPHFASSIYGLLWLGRLLLTAVAVSALIVVWTGSDRPGVLRGMLAAAVLIWLYLHCMQYLLIWYGNLPDEVRWYQDRAQGGWLWLTWFLGAGQTLVLLALFWPLSERRRMLAGLCAFTLALGLAEGAWLALPGLESLQLWSTLLTLVAAWLAGAAAIGLMQIRRAAR